jgi:hypothetical protein
MDVLKALGYPLSRGYKYGGRLVRSLEMAVVSLDYLALCREYAVGIAYDSEVPKKQSLYEQPRK